MKVNYGFTPFYVMEEGCSEQAGQYLAEFGYEKVLIVHDKVTKELGLLDGVIQSIEDSGIDIVSYDKVVPDPPDYIIEEGARFAMEENVDGIIAVGGGSSIDTAKGINVLISNKTDKISKYYGINVQKKPLLKMVAIPTTSGTGSEVSFGAVVTDTATGTKQGIISNHLYPTVALCDPKLSRKMPPVLTAGTGCDALAHAVEAYLTYFTTPMSECFSEKGVELIFKYLPRATKNGDDMEARENMCLAASLGIMALNGGMSSIAHGLGHPMGANWHIPHGLACMYALPYAVIVAKDLFPERIKKLASIMGLDISKDASNDEAASKISDRLKAFRIELGLPTLKELKVDSSKIEQIAAESLKDIGTSLAPVAVTYEQMLGYMQEIYAL